ncbi:histidine kinase-, DNA gyrase B-, and HSP90-like ATPase family protein, partial [Tanacetum coccineum]
MTSPGAGSLVTEANSGLSGGTPSLKRSASMNTDSYMRLPASPLSFNSNNISISGSSVIDGQSTPVQQQQQGLYQGASTATSLPNHGLMFHDNVSQMLQYKISILFRRLGIPCLSEVVTREVIHYGPTDSSYMISLVRWALPYAQRYIYRMHPNEYSQLKLSGFKNVNSLKIVVVEKLCQKYVIKSFGIESKERECCCLLRDNILYATCKSDSHSLFMELSRFLLVGLPLGNFLHMITTMTKSGFTEEKMELFVTNSQDLPNLPYEELQWSLTSTSSPEVESTTTKNLGKNSSWPPVHWKTTPGLDKTSLDAAEGLFESNGDWIIDENPASSMPLVILEDDEALNDQSSVINKGKNKVSVPPQNVITGREGERAAFEYFSSTLSDKKVKWVNEVKESGLPYDILVKGKDKSKEYIEVKSTSVAKKDWFTISMNEWKFAVEKGESFIVARVVLSDGNVPKITTYRNPAKLCQSKKLQLAFHPKYDPIISVTKRKSAWDDNSISGGDSCSQYRIRWKQGVMDESKWWMTVAAHWILSRRNECHEPNSEGSGSAWKAYMNVRVAGLFLLVLLEYPQREEFDATQSHGTYGLLNGVFIIFFVNAELSFCSLTCFKENPAKGVSVFMSFVPLEGEVHGFFSQLPHMIISKLCSSSCLLLQGEDNEWVTPSKVLRNWTEQTRSLLPDRLIREHLDVGYLHKDTLLSDSLARALGIEECGPKVLIQVIASLCDETGKRWKYDPIISVTKRKSAWDDNSISGGDSCSQYRIRWKQEGVMDESKWKQVDKDGIMNVFLGKEKFTWFVKSRTLQADHICHDVQTTEISVALMLEDLGNGNYISKLDQQPVFALFPSRSYGLKFIIQADFIVSSSREEVDAHSPWNQWLLMEFSKFFVNAELSFCSLTCFKENPAKGVSVFMSFVPLEGEVHGFFSQLPHMIISKLCSSSCLLLQGEDNEWVTPSKVLRNWTEQTRSLLPDRLIREHLDVGYLHKDTLLSDSLARALGIEECGPKVLIQVIASLCQADSLRSMGLDWLSSWLNVLFLMLVNATEYDFISSLSELPIIPLLDGSYASINEGAIWLHTDPEHGLEAFGKLYSKLRIVNPALFSDHVENITQML